METNRTYRFLFSLLLLSISLLLLGLALGWTIPLEYLNSITQNNERRLITILLAVIGILLSFLIIKKSFSKRVVKQAEVIETSLGKIKVSLDALENMANKVARQTPGVKETKTKVKPASHGIAIYIQTNLAPDMNIPEVTKILQNNLHNYFKDIVGIEVEEVKVLVTKFSTDNKKGRVE